MKTNLKILTALPWVGLMAVNVAMAKAPLLRVTLLVVDTDGKAMHGALVSLTDESDLDRPAPGATYPKVRGSTDGQGRFTGEIETADPQRVRLRVERNGYMPKRSSPAGKFTVLNGRWEPWARTVKVVLVRFPSVDSADIPDKEPPAFPMGLHVTKATSDSIALKWNAAKHGVKISGYVVYRNGQPIETKEPIRGTTFTDTNLPDGEEFEYAVRAFDFAGSLSHLSDPVLGKTLPAEAGSTQPKLSDQGTPWDRPENWDGKTPGKKTKVK